MQKINIKRTIYRIRHDILTTNNVVIIAAAVIAIGWASGAVGVLERNYKLQRDINSKQRELKLAELEVQTLQYEQRYYESSEYKEMAVRQRLGLALPGEKALILPPNSKEVKDAVDPYSVARTTSVQSSNMEQWLNFLFGNDSATLQG